MICLIYVQLGWQDTIFDVMSCTPPWQETPQWHHKTRTHGALQWTLPCAISTSRSRDGRSNVCMTTIATSSITTSRRRPEPVDYSVMRCSATLVHDALRSRSPSRERPSQTNGTTGVAWHVVAQLRRLYQTSTRPHDASGGGLDRRATKAHAGDVSRTRPGRYHQRRDVYLRCPAVGGWLATVVSTRRSHRAVAPACRTDMVPASEPPSKGLAMRPLMIGILGILLSSMLVAGCGGGDASDPARPTPTPAAIAITPVAMAGEGIGISQPITSWLEWPWCTTDPVAPSTPQRPFRHTCVRPWLTGSARTSSTTAAAAKAMSWCCSRPRAFVLDVQHASGAWAISVEQPPLGESFAPRSSSMGISPVSCAGSNSMPGRMWSKPVTPAWTPQP